MQELLKSMGLDLENGFFQLDTTLIQPFFFSPPGKGGDWLEPGQMPEGMDEMMNLLLKQFESFGQEDFNMDHLNELFRNLPDLEKGAPQPGSRKKKKTYTL